jgi:hypothetical protein
MALRQWTTPSDRLYTAVDGTGSGPLVRGR